ncbi:acyltransferase, partial [Mesorhizobium sp.]|uniref:acyltransferase family protein n=1 Tax=Mesorhizobium sp. TaxID=1871066 RepID=UPI0025BC1900
MACHFGLASLPGSFAGVDIFLVISGLVSFILWAWPTNVSQPWALYFSPLRAWEFAAGGLASMAPARLLQARPLLGRALSLAGLTMIGTAYLTFSEDASFPGFLALLPVAGTVLLLKAGAAGARDGYSPDSERNWVNAALALSPLQWIGRLSYSIHLWHWPVIVYAGMLASELTPIKRLYCLALTLALSALTCRLIENPIRRNGWLMANAARAPVPVLLLTGTGVAAAHGNARLAVRDLDPQQRTIAASAAEPSWRDAAATRPTTPWRRLSATSSTASPTLLTSTSPTASAAPPPATPSSTASSPSATSTIWPRPSRIAGAGGGEKGDVEGGKIGRRRPRVRHPRAEQGAKRRAQTL